MAKSSAVKIASLDQQAGLAQKDEMMEKFRALLDKNYLTLHKPSEYASMLAMTPDNFTKRCNRYFKKTTL